MTADIPVSLRDKVTQICWSRLPRESAAQLAGTILFRLATDGDLASKLPAMANWWIRPDDPNDMINLAKLEEVSRKHFADQDSHIIYRIIGKIGLRTLILWDGLGEDEIEDAWARVNEALDRRIQ